MPIKSQLEKVIFPIEEKIVEVDSLDWIGYDEYVKTEYKSYEEWVEEESEVPSTEILKVPSVYAFKFPIPDQLLQINF